MGNTRLHATAIGVTIAGVAALVAPIRQDPGLHLLFNLAHVPGFALLAVLWLEDLLARGWPRRRRLAAVAALGLLLAMGTEALQSLVPGRYADVGDMARNLLGVAGGLVVHWRWPRLLAPRIDRT